MNARDAGAPAYALGHSPAELDRLGTQARLVDPITRRFFLAAGIAPGMRVLDVGSGAGDVAFLAADLVGDAGEVVGVDRSAVALGTARSRAQARKLPNVRFLEGDPADLAFDRPFDAIVGRYVLMFQPEPGALLRRIATRVRPGGPIVFHEPDWYTFRSVPEAPIYDRCGEWLVQAMGRLGADARMGTRLHATFLEAGLPAPAMGLESTIGGGANGHDRMHLVADLVGTLAPELERLGIATAAEIGIETLADRMREEAIANGSVLVGRAEIGAWARRRGDS